MLPPSDLVYSKTFQDTYPIKCLFSFSGEYKEIDCLTNTFTDH